MLHSSRICASDPIGVTGAWRFCVKTAHSSRTLLRSRHTVCTSAGGADLCAGLPVLHRRRLQGHGRPRPGRRPAQVRFSKMLQIAVSTFCCGMVTSCRKPGCEVVPRINVAALLQHRGRQTADSSRGVQSLCAPRAGLFEFEPVSPRCAGGGCSTTRRILAVRLLALGMRAGGSARCGKIRRCGGGRCRCGRNGGTWERRPRTESREYLGGARCPTNISLAAGRTRRCGVRRALAVREESRHPGEEYHSSSLTCLVMCRTERHN